MHISEATTTDLVQELGKRLPTFAAAYHVPDDNGRCDTRTFLAGNRATLLGMAHLLVAQCEVKLGMRPAIGEPTPDDPPNDEE